MSKNFGSLAEFGTFLAGMVVKVDHAEHEALKEAAVIVENEAKRVIGTYDYGWPQLAQSTQDDRVAQGFSANEPGLRSEAMRDSIEHTVVGHEAQIGSNDDHLVYFELGTSKQPPRSDLAGAAIAKEKEIVAAIGSAVHTALIKP
jgi:DNA-directed RNA polymerase subunit H (RpoH/RPB5)